MNAFEEKLNAVRKAYDAGLYEPTLALVLTLPDICSAIEYPNIKQVGERFVKWSNNHIFLENLSNDKENFTGAALYQLRCKFLHSGNEDIYKVEGPQDKRVYIKKFELMLPKKKEGDISELLVQEMKWKDSETQVEFYTIKMNLRYVIDKICDAVWEFYDNWQNKNDFENHSIQFLKYKTGEYK